MARIYAEPATRERLYTTAQGLMDHLLSNEPGWGNWPSDTGEALYVGVLLSIWIRDAIAAERPGMTKEDLDQLELSILERLIKCKELNS